MASGVAQSVPIFTLSLSLLLSIRSGANQENRSHFKYRSRMASIQGTSYIGDGNTEKKRSRTKDREGSNPEVPNFWKPQLEKNRKRRCNHKLGAGITRVHLERDGPVLEEVEACRDATPEAKEREKYDSLSFFLPSSLHSRLLLVEHR